MTACHHPDRGLAWKMEPVDGGEVRRVRLCGCGLTLLARLGATGDKCFDDLAARELGRTIADAAGTVVDDLRLP